MKMQFTSSTPRENIWLLSTVIWQTKEGVRLLFSNGLMTQLISTEAGKTAKQALEILLVTFG